MNKWFAHFITFICRHSYRRPTLFLFLAAMLTIPAIWQLNELGLDQDLIRLLPDENRVVLLKKKMDKIVTGSGGFFAILLESPDEILNYENLLFIAEKRSLPVLEPGEFSKAHHPPLYYVIGAAFIGSIPHENLPELAANTNPFWGFRLYESGVDNKSQYLRDRELESWPYEDVALAIHLMRWLSLLMGAGVIIVTYKTARDLFLNEPYLAPGLQRAHQ